MRRGLSILLLLLAYVGIPTLYAADSRFSEDYYTKFRNLTSLDGLSHNCILDINQDRYGFIWIATAHGLNRYDGHSFKSFVHDTNDSTSIPGNHVTSIDFDIHGKMWVGTNTGLAFYNTSSESFTSFCIHSQEKSGLSDPYVRGLTADATQAILWVETVDGTLNRIDLETNDIQHYKHERINTTTYDYHEVFQDLDSEIWVGGRGFGPLKFNKKQLTFKKLPVDPNDNHKKRDSDIASIFQDRDQLFWMGATDGFYQYYSQSNTFQKHLGTSTFDIIEDDGFNLWLGTGGGLMKYNKYNDKFIVYRHDVNNEYSIIHNHVNVIFKDRNENLWLGTAKGLSVLYKKKNLFTHYRHVPEMVATMPHDDVRTFLELDDGKVWIGTNHGGVIEWDRELNSFVTIKGTEGKRISSMYQDKKGDIWLGMWSGKGFLKYDKNKKISHYAFDHTSLKRDWYNDFYEDDKGRFWVAIWGASGVHFFDRYKGEFEEYTLRLSESPARTYIDKVAVQNDYIWTQWKQRIGHRYNPREQQYEGWGKHDSSKLVLPEWRNHHHYHYDENMGFNSVFAIVESPQKKLSYWCTNDGLYVFDDGFNRLSFSESFKECYHVVFSRDNQLYICTERGVFRANIKSLEAQLIVANDLCYFTKIFDLGNAYLGAISEHKMFLYSSEEDSLISSDLDTSEFEIFRSTNDVLVTDSVYVATDNGLVVMDSNLKSYSLYNMSNSFDNGLLSEKINGIIKQSKDSYWLATAKGLFLYNSKKCTFRVIKETLNIPVNGISRMGNTLWLATFQGLAYYSLEKQNYGVVSNMTKHQLSSHLISFIEDDNSDNIWVGTTNSGVNILDKENYNIHQFLPDENSLKAFWGDNASDFAISKLGIVFISSNQGINVYHPSDSTFSHITTKSGLPSDEVLGIEFDNEGFLWILTPEALAIYDHSHNNVKMFSSEWGLIPYLFSGDITLVDDEMLIPTDKGFYSFYPKELRAQEFHNSPGFTGVKVFSNDKKSDLLEHRQVVLNYDENFFTINFSDFYFSETASIFYYKLVGIDPDWVQTDQNYAAYTNIKYGKYELLLSTDKNYRTRISPQSISIIIKPPLWRKPWFLLIEILFVFLILYLVYRQRIQQYERREKQLKTEQKLLRSQMNPHFVFNALIAIQSFIFKNEPKEAGRYLSKFAKLMRLFLQNTRQDNIFLSQEIQTLEHYMELQRLRFNDNFDFKITCDDSFDAEEIKLPPMMAQPFIENAVEHAFIGVNYKGKIEVGYFLKQESIEIFIRDNGIGVNRSKLNKKHKSLATVITRERLKGLSSRSKIYKLEIKDLSEISDNETGTLVTLSVPYVNSYTLN